VIQKKLVQCERFLYCSFKQNICMKQKNFEDDCDDYEPKPIPDIVDGSNYNVICPGGSQCIEKTSVSPGKRCWRVGYKGINTDCVDSSECALALTCRKNTQGNFQCLRFLADRRCPNSGNQNCTRDQYCICGDGGAQNTCKQIVNSGCRESETAVRWNDCWRSNNCPLERNMLIAFFVDVFQPETCLGKSCGNIPTDYSCCNLKPYEGAIWSPVAAYPINCGSPIGSVLAVLLGVGFVVSQIVLIALLITYIVLRNRYKSNYGEY